MGMMDIFEAYSPKYESTVRYAMREDDGQWFLRYQTKANFNGGWSKWTKCPPPEGPLTLNTRRKASLPKLVKHRNRDFVMDLPSSKYLVLPP